MRIAAAFPLRSATRSNAGRRSRGSARPATRPARTCAEIWKDGAALDPSGLFDRPVNARADRSTGQLCRHTGRCGAWTAPVMLPLFLLAAAVREAGHLLVLYLSGGQVYRLTLTCCSAVLRCALPDGRCARAAVCLAGPAASFALTAAANTLGALPARRRERTARRVQPAAHAAARRRDGALPSRGWPLPRRAAGHRPAGRLLPAADGRAPVADGRRRVAVTSAR